MIFHGLSRDESPSTPLSDFQRAEETRLLAEGIRVGCLAALPAIILLALIAQDVTGAATLGAWIVTASTFHLGMAALAHRTSSTQLPADSLSKRLATLNGVAGFAGLVWGAGGWLLLPIDDPVHRAQSICLMAGLWLGAGATLGASTPALAWFLALSALPTVIRIGISEPHRDSLWVGLSLAALVAVLIVGAARTRRGMADSIRLRLEGETREKLLQDQRTRLVESEEKYRLLFERSEDPMWLIVGDRFMLANDAAARFLEYDDAQAITNLHPSQLSPPRQPCGTPSDDLAEQMMATAHAQGYHRFEWMHITRLGKEIPVEVTLTRVPYEGDWALYCVWRDISDRHRAALDLQAARELAEQASVAKTTFLTTMSHEIRTPLSAVLGMAELLDDTPLDEYQREFTRSITTAGQNLLAVINDVLDLSKIEAGRLELSLRTTDLTLVLENLERVFRLRAQECGLDFVIDMQDSCPRQVIADDSRLTQILINLCGNACKFTTEGEVRVTASGSRDSEGAWRLILAVSDTGVGIEASAQRTLFAPFQQAAGDTSRRYGGTGLGLSISSHLSELMGGVIRLKSAPGEGSTFTVELPVELPVERPVERSVGLRVGTQFETPAGTRVGTPIETPAETRAGTPIETPADLPADLPVEPRLEAPIGRPADQQAELPGELRVRAPIETPADLQAEPPAEIPVETPAELPAELPDVLRVKQAGDWPAGPDGKQTMTRGSGAGLVEPGCAPPAAVILVVDDVTINRRVAAAMLTSLGLSPTFACDGEEAVRVFLEGGIDIILMDCQMPVMDGFTATRRIRELEQGTDRHIPIIALTAAAMSHDRTRCEEAGMDDFLAKPFRRADLAAAVARWLRAVDGGLASGGQAGAGGDGNLENGDQGRRQA